MYYLLQMAYPHASAIFLSNYCEIYNNSSSSLNSTTGTTTSFYFPGCGLPYY